MKIIGHRGAAGTELENTLASMQVAKDYGVDTIEFDVRRTKDNKLVVFHDSDLHRVADNSSKINQLTLKELQKIPLINGAHIPTLDETLDVVGDVHCIIEVKDTGTAETLVTILKRHESANFTIASFKFSELALLRVLEPSYTLYALERTRPFDIIHIAKRLKMDGIGINYWILNPLTYWLCRRAGLDIYAYTIDNKWVAAFVSKLYPKVGICTNYPEHYLPTSQKKNIRKRTKQRQRSSD